MHRLLWKQSQTRLISIPLIVVADKKNTIGCSDGTSNTNQEPGIMKMQQKKMICSCNLRFWLKIFQSSANFLEESCISRALWATAIPLRNLTNRNFLAQKYQNNKPLNIMNLIFQAKWYKIFLSIFEKLNYNHFFKNIINYCLYTTKIF